MFYNLKSHKIWSKTSISSCLRINIANFQSCVIFEILENNIKRLFHLWKIVWVHLWNQNKMKKCTNLTQHISIKVNNMEKRVDTWKITAVDYIIGTPKLSVSTPIIPQHCESKICFFFFSFFYWILFLLYYYYLSTIVFYIPLFVSVKLNLPCFFAPCKYSFSLQGL